MEPNDCNLNIEKGSNLIRSVNDLCESLYEVLQESDEFHGTLKNIQNSLNEVSEWAHEYDHHGVQANGFWSAIRFFECYLKELHGQKNSGTIDKELIHIAKVGLFKIQIIQLLRQRSLALKQDNNGMCLEVNSITELIDTYKLFLNQDDELMTSLFGNHYGFWYKKSIRTMMKLFIFASITMHYFSFTEFFAALFSKAKRGELMTRVIKSGTAEHLFKIYQCSEFYVYTTILPKCMYFGGPNIAKDIFISRQNTAFHYYCRQEYGIHINRSKFVKCRVLRQDSADQTLYNGCVILHCHGGAFVCGSPYSHQIYLYEWARKLPNATIISVDYSLAPKAKFPVALLEILDVYLWLTGNDPKVKEKIGVSPKQMVLAGDSAGSFLVMTLCHLLNDLRKKSPAGHKMPMPIAIVCPYAVFNTKLQLSPSLLMSAIDGILSTSVIFSSLTHYIPEVKGISSKCTESSEEITEETNASQWNIIKLLNKIKRYLFGSPPSPPWYMTDKEDLIQKMEQISAVTCKRYLCPLDYEDFDSLSNVSLHLIISHFDPFLDQNVTMAKRWKGPITLDVLEGMNHGFLNLVPFSPDARKANDLCVKKIQEAFQHG